MTDCEQKIGKFMVGRIVQHDDKYWVVVQHLSGLNVSACPMKGSMVLWRSPKFIGEEWDPTEKEPVKIPHKPMQIISPLNDGLRLCLDPPEGV